MATTILSIMGPNHIIKKPGLTKSF
ncbi:hypothetical protein CCACVL1_00127 [Corchorus capsularis]|uniref:Uncharacterized protein n=1 Tax=Corchorus capsularis TaxID=210143 RepID=A0A1R3KYE0_COCAP|nr:hypothetical protein CCACVL1_00127 [Corchorus capsularis]